MKSAQILLVFGVLGAPSDNILITSSIICPEFDDNETNALLYPHEKYCYAFYACHNGQLTELYCPHNLLFNSELKVCDWPGNVSCEDKSTRTPTTTTTTITETTTINAQPINHCPQTQCQDSTIYLPDPTNTRKFIRCVHGVEEIGICPADLVFDKILSVCHLEHLAQT